MIFISQWPIGARDVAVLANLCSSPLKVFYPENLCRTTTRPLMSDRVAIAFLLATIV
jgi:hypothetical protein